MKKRDIDVNIMFLMYLSIIMERGPPKVFYVGTRWMRNLIPHPMSALTRNLSETTLR